MHRVLMDTDIGSDVDDMLALAYLMNSNNLKLEALTTVHGKAKLRAFIAKKFINSFHEQIPVAYGNDRPLARKEIYLYGHEGNNMVFLDKDKDVSSDYLNLMKDKIIEMNGGMNILSIGPMTNLANLFSKHSEVVPLVKHLYFMGAIDDNGIPEPSSHNVKVDPASSKIVFASGVPITVLPKEVALKTEFTRRDFESIRGLHREWSWYVYYNASDYLANNGIYDVSHLYDPLTLGMLDKPKLFQFEYRGCIRIAKDVDADAFKQHLLYTLGVT